MSLRDKIKKFVLFDEAEAKDKEFALKLIDMFKDVLTRENELCHFSASAFVVNKNRTKMLVVHHNIYNGWITPGGHADGEENLLNVAMREVEEETGLKALPLDTNIFALSAFPIVGHIKRDKHVSAHIHIDAMFILEADDSIPLIYREDESSGVKWITLEEALSDDIVYFAKPINKRLIERMWTEKL